MIARVLNHLYGYERLRHRGDRLFLSGEFERARHEYARARSVLRTWDYRRFTIDALIRECDCQSPHHRDRHDASALVRNASEREPTLPDSVSGDLPAFHPGLEDLFELAIAEKEAGRIDAYRTLSDEFKAGYVALVQGNAERAIRFLSAAASAPSPSFVVNMELGRAQSLAGDMSAAREALELANRSASGDVEVAVLLSAVNIELGRFQEAYERLVPIARHDGKPDVTYLVGRALAGMHRDDAALEKFRETVAREPNFDEAYFEASRLVGKNGDREAQFRLLNRACALVPDEIRYNRELARLVLEDSFDEEAGLAACDRLMITDEDQAWEYLYWIAQLYIRRGWRREARDPLEKSLRLVPSDRTHARREIEACLAGLEI